MIDKSGDDMNIEKIKNMLTKDNRVVFKLYSLEYAIEIVEKQVRIYSLIYPDNIKFYSTLEELLYNFRVYNEYGSRRSKQFIESKFVCKQSFFLKWHTYLALAQAQIKETQEN